MGAIEIGILIINEKHLIRECSLFRGRIETFHEAEGSSIEYYFSVCLFDYVLCFVVRESRQCSCYSKDSLKAAVEIVMVNLNEKQLIRKCSLFRGRIETFLKAEGSFIEWYFSLVLTWLCMVHCRDRDQKLALHHQWFFEGRYLIADGPDAQKPPDRDIHCDRSQLLSRFYWIYIYF